MRKHVHTFRFFQALEIGISESWIRIFLPLMHALKEDPQDSREQEAGAPKDGDRVEPVAQLADDLPQPEIAEVSVGTQQLHVAGRFFGYLRVQIRYKTILQHEMFPIKVWQFWSAAACCRLVIQQ
jgi:hypothetical protein